MNHPAVPLIGNRQAVPKTAWSAGDRQPNVAIVYVTKEGRCERLDDGRPLNLGEALWSSYRHRIDVDTGDHEVELHIAGQELPSTDAAFHFIATIEAGFRVSDPAEIVRRNVTDGLVVVRSRLIQLIRPTCRKFPIDLVADAEAAVNDQFVRPVLLAEGIEVYRCYLRLSLDQAAKVHADALRAARQQETLVQMHRRSEIGDAMHQGDIGQIRAASDADQLRQKVEAISAMNIDERKLIDIYLAQNPANAAEAINLLNQKEQSRYAREDVRNAAVLEMYKFLLDNNLLRAPQANALVNQLTGLISSSAQTGLPAAPGYGGAGQLALHSGGTGPSAIPAAPAGAPTPAPHAGHGGRGVIPLSLAASSPAASSPAASSPAAPPAPAYAATATTSPAATPPATAPIVAPASRPPAARPPAPAAPSTRMKLPQPHSSAGGHTPQPAVPAQQGTPTATAQTSAVQPVYVLVDESAHAGRWGAALEGGLADLLHRIGAQPAVAAVLPLAVLGLSESVRVLRPFGPVDAGAATPRVRLTGELDFAAAFDDLLGRIPTDVAALKQNGSRVNRPVVFFLCTSQPERTEAWAVLRGRLTDPAVLPAAPNIVACGVAGVTSWAVRAVATRTEFGFVASPDVDPGTAIMSFWQSVTNSLLSSGTALASGTSSLSVQRPDGFQIANDEV